MSHETVKTCPDCRGEYRLEIQRCADCGGPLVLRQVGEEVVPRLEPAAPAVEASAPAASAGAGSTSAGSRSERWVLLEVNRDDWAESLRESLESAQLRALLVLIPPQEEPAKDRQPAVNFAVCVLHHQLDLARRVAVEHRARQIPDFEDRLGATQASACPACGAALPADGPECPECGLVLG